MWLDSTVRYAGGMGAAVLRPVVGRATDLSLAALDAALASRLAREAMDRVVASSLVEQTAARVLEGPELERVVAQALDSPAMERVVARVIESRLLDEAVERLLESEELWVLVEEIAQSPAVTDAITRQSLGFADQVAGGVRVRSRSADDWLERVVRRALRRRPSPSVGGDGESPAVP
jgi:hypothetical protein